MESPDRDGSPDDRRSLLLIEDAASATTLDAFTTAVIDGVARLVGVDRVALWLGSAPDDGVELSAGEDVGFHDRVMQRYIADFVDADPFRQPIACREFQRRGIVDLDRLRGGLPIESADYIRRFLGEEGVTQQRALWLDTGGEVHGYLSVLNSDGRDLPHDLDTVLQRARPALSSLLRLHLDNARVRMIPVDEHSPAERRVLDLVLLGRSNREIADELRISEHTVKKHLTSVFRRRGVTSRAELIASTT